MDFFIGHFFFCGCSLGSHTACGSGFHNYWNPFLLENTKHSRVVDLDLGNSLPMTDRDEGITGRKFSKFPQLEEKQLEKFIQSIQPSLSIPPPVMHTAFPFVTISITAGSVSASMTSFLSFQNLITIVQAKLIDHLKIKWSFVMDSKRESLKLIRTMNHTQCPALHVGTWRMKKMNYMLLPRLDVGEDGVKGVFVPFTK